MEAFVADEADVGLRLPIGQRVGAIRDPVFRLDPVITDFFDHVSRYRVAGRVEQAFG